MTNSEFSWRSSRWRKALVCGLVGVSGFAVQGCATAIRGTNTDFVVQTTPAGASVRTDLMTPASRREMRDLKSADRYDEATFEPVYFECEATPCTFEVPRKSNFTVEIEHPGYHPATIEIKSGIGQGASASATGATVVAAGAYVVSYATYAAAISSIALGTGAALSIGTLGLISPGAVLSASSGSAALAAGPALVSAAGLGVIMLGVDLVSGAMHDLSPNPLVIVLVPDTQPMPVGTQEIINSEERLQDVLDETGAQLVVPVENEEVPADSPPVSKASGNHPVLRVSYQQNA